MVKYNKRESKKSSHSKAHTHSSGHSHISHSHKYNNKKDILADSYKKLKAGRPIIVGHAQHGIGSHDSIREAEYKGHKITIRTHYDIRVDNKPLGGHFYVGNDGNVSTHAMPAYSFSSTIDLVKQLIDSFPNEFRKRTRAAKRR
ncbi:MAG: hypothetical protein ACRD93_02490 [Nitrososphaeraceae archaeon]